MGGEIEDIGFAVGDGGEDAVVDVVVEGVVGRGEEGEEVGRGEGVVVVGEVGAVSYTHLTLPTKRIV